jgi:ABC-type multidrug transport system permease subunit
MVDRMQAPVHQNHYIKLFEGKSIQYLQPFVASTVTVMRRQFKLLLRNTAFIKGRLLMVIVMGLLYGVTFYQMDPSVAQVVMGMIFSSMMFISVVQASQVNTCFASRKIFYKQRGGHFYGTASYVLSSSLAQIPFAVSEALVFGSLVYWMAGFVADTIAYLVFIIGLALLNLTFAAWFFFISSMAPKLIIAQPISFFSILLYVIFAGFLVVKQNLPKYCLWLFSINPMANCFQSLAIKQIFTRDVSGLYVQWCGLLRNDGQEHGHVSAVLVWF